MRLKSAHLSEKGPLRTVNADALVADDQLGFFAVADGVGSMPASIKASAFAVKTAHRRIQEISAGADHFNPKTFFEDVRRDYELNFASHPSLPATTLSVAVVAVRQLTYFNVGDSPIFHLSDSVRLLTRKHTAIDAELYFSDFSTMKSLDGSNVLRNYLGSPTAYAVQYNCIDLDPGSRIVLCSDGVMEIVPQARLYDIHVKSKSADDFVSSVQALAALQRPPDNYTLIVIDT